ncbi:MAG: 7TM diverse intracellular signaling domain-containing protein [Bacteroidia bacterium]
MKQLFQNSKSFILFLFVFSGLNVCADNQILEINDINTVNASPYLFCAEKPSAIKNPQEALQKINFKKCGNDLPTTSQSKDGYWFLLKIVNQSSHNEFRLAVNNPIIDEIDYYLFTSDTILERHAGEYLPFKKHKYNNPVYAFKILLNQGDTGTILLRISGIEDYFLPVTISGEKQILETQSQNNLLLGIYAGLMLVMFFYNLFIFFTVRDRSYLLYVFYILVVFITQLCSYGIPFQYLWPENIWLQIRSLIIFPVLSGIFGLLFMREFLQIKQNLKSLNYAVFFLVAVYVLVYIVMFTGNLHFSYKLLQGTSVAVSLFMFFTALMLSLKGSRQATFFIISWSFFLAGIILFVLKDVGALPFNFITQFSMPIGSAVEVVLLSFALGDKINVLTKEKEQSQAEALKASLENQRLIEEQNVMLERKVDERTKDLQQALKDLKDTQSQLVDQEKMASLGQLTAGIAHEINNPINFVTSNVSPLKRDINIIYDLLNQYENIVTDEKSTIQDKQKLLEKLKKDADIDYLKHEIDYLLKGIGEGASRTSEIVKGLRIFSRLDEDAIKKADVIEGIESTIIIINNQLSKIRLDKNFTGTRIIECYPGKLNQVFLNLLSNAIYAVKQKFKNEEGGVLTISSSSDDNFVYLNFKDNGCGMNDETQKRIFEPFFTTKPVGEGTGLGMSIVFKTIEQHKGGITLKSKLGEGTEFNIKLPIILL